MSLPSESEQRRIFSRRDQAERADEGDRAAKVLEEMRRAQGLEE
jgi:hypothetical protein